MQIFISWSGPTSHKVALAIRDWLPCVINEAKPFVSSEDIRKGNRWLLDVSKELATTKFGIICLTAENLSAPWILFEAGALSKSLKDSQVCTLLLGQLKPADVKGPLASFQHTVFNREDFRKLIAGINKQAEEQLSEVVITKIFDKWWDELESSISKILASSKGATKMERSDSDVLNEILELSRYVARNTKDEIERSEIEKMKKLLSYPTKDIGFSQETMEGIERVGLSNIVALTTRTEQELLEAGFSQKSLKEIRRGLAKLGLSLGMTFDPVVLPG